MHYVHFVCHKGRRVHGSTDVKVAGVACLLLLSELVESLVIFRSERKSLRWGWTFLAIPKTVAPCCRIAALQGRVCLKPGRRGAEQEEKRFWKMWVKWSGTWLLMAGFPPASCQLIDFNDVSERWPVPLPPGSMCPSCLPMQREWQQRTNKVPHGTDCEVLNFPFRHLRSVSHRNSKNERKWNSPSCLIIFVPNHASVT